tara:strand:+ start:1286 stop:1663 length:378 start_codon:yes stop_codon:yes gene_type:complete
MATKLTKPIIRETEISGEDYIVSLTMTDIAAGDGVLYGEPLITLRKKGSRGTPPEFLLKDFLEEKPKTHSTDMIPYKEVMSKLSALHSEEAKPLEAIVRDIFEVNVLASDLSDEEVVAKGVALPE